MFFLMQGAQKLIKYYELRIFASLLLGEVYKNQFQIMNFPAQLRRAG